MPSEFDKVEEYRVMVSDGCSVEVALPGIAQGVETKAQSLRQRRAERVAGGYRGGCAREALLPPALRTGQGGGARRAGRIQECNTVGPLRVCVRPERSERVQSDRMPSKLRSGKYGCCRCSPAADLQPWISARRVPVACVRVKCWSFSRKSSGEARMRSRDITH